MRMKTKTYNEFLKRIQYLETRLNGGKGSGNFGHSGRPGKVGGSGLGAQGILDKTGHGVNIGNEELDKIWNSFDDDVLISDNDAKILKDNYFGTQLFSKVQKVARQEGLDTLDEDEKDKAEKTKEILDDYIDSSSLSQDITLYRGITLTDENAALFKKGREISDAGFASTSLNPSETTRMRGDGTFGGKRNIVVLKISAKKGSKGLKSPVRGDDKEYEVVLPRNANFKIKSVGKWQRFYESDDDLKYDNKRVKIIEVDYE